MSFGAAGAAAATAERCASGRAGSRSTVDAARKDTPAPQVAPDNAEEAEDAAMEEAEPVPAPAAAAPEPTVMETELVVAEPVDEQL